MAEKVLRNLASSQQGQVNLGSTDPMASLMANQKAGIKLGGGRRSGGGPSTNQAKFETVLNESPTVYEVRNTERYYENSEGKATNLEALEAQGFDTSELHKSAAEGRPKHESITKDGVVMNLDRENVQNYTVRKDNGDGTFEEKVIQGYGYRSKGEVFGNKQSILRAGAMDMASRAGFSPEQAEAWFTKNWDKHTDLVKGGESHTWRALIKNIQIKDINTDTLSEFYSSSAAGDWGPGDRNKGVIEAYNAAYRSPTQYTKVGAQGKVQQSSQPGTVNVGNDLYPDEQHISPANILRKQVDGLTGNDRFIFPDNTGIISKNVQSEAFKSSLVMHKDTEGSKVLGSSFSIAETYLHLKQKNISGGLNPDDGADQDKAFDTLVELGVISEFEPAEMSPAESRKVYADAVNFMNDQVLPKALKYGQGLSGAEKDILQEFNNSAPVKNLRNSYLRATQRKKSLMDNFLTDTDIGKEMMVSSEGLFNDDLIQTMDSDVPFSPNSPGSIDSLVDTLASLSNRDERQRFITRNLRGKLTPKGERWINRLNNNISLVLKRVDADIDTIGDALDRRPVVKPLASGPTFGNRVEMFFTDDISQGNDDITYNGTTWQGDPEDDSYNIVSGLDALEQHWAGVESLNFKENNVEVSNHNFIFTVINKAKNDPEYKAKLQRRVGLTDNQLNVLLDTVPDLNEFELDRELLNIRSIREQPVQNTESTQVQPVLPTGPKGNDKFIPDFLRERSE